MPAGKSVFEVVGPVSRILVIVSLLTCSVWLAGCESVSEYAPSWGEPKIPEHERLASTYEQIIVKKSLTLDVLPKMDALTGELKSQSESAVASAGKSDDGQRTWFTLVAFHQYNLSVVRKYFFAIDEKASRRSQRGLRFDCEIVLDKSMLESIDTNSNAGKLAILQSALTYLRSDIADVGAGGEATGQANQTLDLGTMILNQAFSLARLKLESSSVLISQLSEPQGVSFEHMSFEKGRIGLVIKGGVATVKLRLGALADSFQEAY